MQDTDSNPRETAHANRPATKLRTGELPQSIYAELRLLAAQKMAGCAPGQSLGPTAVACEALNELARQNERKARLVKRRRFVGLNAEEG